MPTYKPHIVYVLHYKKSVHFVKVLIQWLMLIWARVHHVRHTVQSQKMEVVKDIHVLHYRIVSIALLVVFSFLLVSL